MTLTAAHLNGLFDLFAGYDSLILNIMHRLATSAGKILTPLMKLITLLGEKGLLLIAVAVALMLFARTRRAGVCMFGAIACGAILTNFILKDWVARPRPLEIAPYLDWAKALGVTEDGFSFPSGHVTAAMAGMSALCFTRGRKWIIPSVLWVLLMAVSRNYLMAHYPSDVLFAALVGLLSAIIAYLITLLIFRVLEDHDDLPLCAFLLDFSLFRRSAAADGEEDESDEDEEVDADSEPVRRPVVRRAAEPEEPRIPAIKGYQGKHLK